MDKHYWKQFSDNTIERLLLKEENIDVLDSIFNQEIERIGTLKLKKYSQGQAPYPSDLSSLLEEVKPHVDDFLGVSGIQSPTINYNQLFSKDKMFPWIAFGFAAAGFGLSPPFLNPNPSPVEYAAAIMSLGLFGFSLYSIRASLKELSFYTDNLNCIALQKEPRTLLIPIIAHKYAHHVQKKKGLGSFLSRKLTAREGQARSVQRQVSRDYAEKEDNPAFSILYSQAYDLPELLTVKSWLCNKLRGMELPKVFFNPIVAANHFYLQKYRKPTPHALGNAFFSILEAHEGVEIHKEIMAGRYQLPSF